MANLLLSLLIFALVVGLLLYVLKWFMETVITLQPGVVRIVLLVLGTIALIFMLTNYIAPLLR